MRGGVGIFGQLLGPFFGFCTEKLRFFGFVVRCSFRFSVFFAKIKGARFLCGSLCSQMLGYFMFLNFIVNPSQTAMLSVSVDCRPTVHRDERQILGETVLQFCRLVSMFHKSLISLRSRLRFWKLSCKLFSYDGFVFGFRFWSKSIAVFRFFMDANAKHVLDHYHETTCAQVSSH